LEIRKKLDHLFEELQAKQKEQTNLNDFVTTLLLDHYQPGSSEEREKRLWRRAESCGLVKSRGIQEEKPSYVVLTTMLLDTQGNNITIREISEKCGYSDQQLSST
jgi:AraC-like DNA-binding protein